MDNQKKQLLEKTYRDWLSIQLDKTTPLELLDAIATKDIMGYGTTLEEKLFGVDSVKNLVIAAREQAEQFQDIKFENPTSVHQQIYPDNGVAIFVGEVVVKYTYRSIQNIVPLRISTVMVYLNDLWKITHWHASVAIETEEGDTFHIDELQLKNQKLEQLVEERTAELKQSLADLKATQAQLIHSEKMASLGELTAGIAHEIQNPLNFINNFSEVNNELIDEVKESRAKSQETRAKTEYDELEDEILEDIKQNLEKINHHGKRADRIVKGMLQHSRASGDKKEPTDLNKLADEYLRLAYHGMRAKDKSFNAALITNFDENLPIVKIIPQDIGRVILNLLTNAFYACQEKQKSSPDSYKPTVSISTNYSPLEGGQGGVLEGTQGTVQINITDNGNGIPEHIKEKIFQPFFTTKPTGEGTGLGLSMSYDIVTAGHGGELTVETKEGKGTIFTILIPIE